MIPWWDVSCGRTEAGWAQPCHSPWGGQRKENSQNPEKGESRERSHFCPVQTVKQKVKLELPGTGWEALTSSADLQWYENSFIPLFSNSLSKLLPLAFHAVRQIDQDFQSCTSERISLERYHESNCSNAEPVSSCLLHGPGWFDVQKQGLCNSFLHGLICSGSQVFLIISTFMVSSFSNRSSFNSSHLRRLSWGLVLILFLFFTSTPAYTVLLWSSMFCSIHLDVSLHPLCLNSDLILCNKPFVASYYILLEYTLYFPFITLIPFAIKCLYM